MEPNSETLTASNFFDELQRDKLSTPLPFSLLGMVKKSEGSAKTFEFAPGVKCGKWITVSLDFIDTVEIIKTVPCKDHSHLLVKMNLKEPQTTEGKFLFSILEAITPSIESFHQHIEGSSNDFYSSNANPFNRGSTNGFWGCHPEMDYCGCDNPIDCFLMGASGKCKGKQTICGRNGCVCIPISR